MDNNPLQKEADGSSSETPCTIGGVSFTLDDKRYKVVGLLGRGTFGVVAAGLDKRTGNTVAIKRICPITHKASGARHILREVAIMRLLRHHPNVSAGRQRGRK